MFQLWVIGRMNKDLIKSCRDCCLRGQFQNGKWGCALDNKVIDLDKDYCSRGMIECSRCAGCGTPLVKGYNEAFALQIGENQWQLYCGNCYTRISR